MTLSAKVKEKAALLVSSLIHCTERGRIKWRVDDGSFYTDINVGLNQYRICITRTDPGYHYSKHLLILWRGDDKIDEFDDIQWIDVLWNVARREALNSMGVYDELLKELGSLENES